MNPIASLVRCLKSHDQVMRPPGGSSKLEREEQPREDGKQA